MSKQEDFGRPEKPFEKTRELDNEVRTSKKAKMKRKFNWNQKWITLLFNILDSWDNLQISISIFPVVAKLFLNEASDTVN